MARQGIGTGSSPNDGTGDNLRAAGGKINDNFTEVYNYFGDGNNLSFSGGVWDTVSTGINTLSSVGIGTTNPRFTLEVGAVGASGTSLYVNGDARVTGILTVGSSSISLNGFTNEITVGAGITISGNTGIISATQVNIGGETLTGAGVTSLVAGSNISLSGNTGQVTISSSGGGGGGGVTVQDEGSALSTVATTLNFVGSGVVASGTGATKTITVSGGGSGITTANINADTLSVSGVSTFSGNINLNAANVVLGLSGGSSDDRLKFHNSEIYQDTSSFKIISNTGGIVLRGGGTSSWSNASGAEDYIVATENGSVSLYYDNSKKLETIGTGVTVTGDTFTNQLNVSGVSTFSGTSLFSGNVDVNAHVSFKASGGNSSLFMYDENAINLGSSNDARIIYNNTGNIVKFERSGSAGEIEIDAAPVTLKHSDNIKLQTTTTGISVGAGTSTNTVNTPALTLSYNNPTVVGTAGTTGQVKQIGGQPYYYDGTTWRALFLVGAASTVNQADSDWDNTMIRMNFDQANIGAATNLKDGRTPSNSLVDLVSSPIKYGSKSARFQTNNGGLKFAQDNSGSIYYPFEGAWTLEGWFYFDSSTLPTETNITDSPILFANWHPVTNVSRNWKIGYYLSSGTIYNFYWHNKNSSATGSNKPGNTTSGFMLQQLAATQFADNAWHHIAIVREPENGSIHFYLDGDESNLTDNNELIDNQIYDTTTHSFAIGAYQLTGDTGQFEGNIDDIRVSKSARYTSNFTPPSSALPITGSTTTVYEPADSKVGEISLGGSPAWTGTPGVTASQVAAGQYRATFATAYSNATDYVIQTSMNDYTPATTPVGIGVSRFTTHADFFINRVSDGAVIDTGSLAIDLFKK